MPKTLSAADIADFRDRLCDAAETMFAAHGPEAVTIRQLAARIGVSPMTPYRYFRDKDAILAAVRARAFDRHAQALESAHAGHPGDPVARANAIGAAYVTFALEHPSAYRLMFDINQPGADDYPDLVRATERSRATMTLHIRGLAAAGLFDGDAELAGHLYWAALHGPLMLQFCGLLPAAYDARVLIGVLTAALTGAIFRASAPGETEHR